jgi:SAM-dependent methyltransferase
LRGQVCSNRSHSPIVTRFFIKHSCLFLLDIDTILKNSALSVPWIQGSKCSGTFQFWISTRAFISDAIKKSGTILDIGCANGFLLACLTQWLQQKSLTLTPYGIECDPSVLQCKRLFPHLYDNGHFIQIDLETFLSSPAKEAPAFPPLFDFIYWNVWENGCELEEELHQRWLCILCSMTSLGGKLLLGLYGTKEKNDIKSKKIKAIIIQNFPYIEESHILTFKALDYSHTLLSIDVHPTET